VANRPWYRADPIAFAGVLREVASIQPKLTLVDQGDAALLQGTFDVREGDTVYASFEVEITPDVESPHGIPRVREVGGRIPRKMDPHHVNTDGTLCVLLPDAYWFAHPNGLDLPQYLEGPLRSHLAGQEVVLRGKPWPAGEWSHGTVGIAEFYTDLLGSSNLRSVLPLLEWTTRARLPLLLECACRSGRLLRDCHGPVVAQLKERIPRKVREQAFKALRNQAGLTKPWAGGRVWRQKR